MNVKFKKRTMTAVAIACLTAFAASAQASPRAVTVPNNAKSTVATAAKIIKNNLSHLAGQEPVSESRIRNDFSALI